MLETLFGLGFGVLILIAILWWLPIIFILRSDKTHGGEKLFWLLLIFFFSWFSWLLYALLAPLSARRPQP